MPFTHAFLVPDIYPSFHCKGGSCRSTCCKGWGISVSMEEYFRLLGMDCPPDIRRRLDCAFYAPKDASPERFRLINPRFDGDCPLRAEDGLCALQLACGEAALPRICRVYPRAFRGEFAYECSCSNSCEAVLEQLFGREAPLTFRSVELTIPDAPPAGKALRHPRGYYGAIRTLCCKILQKRALPLPERIARVGLALRALEPLLDAEAGRMGEEIERQALCLDPLPPFVPDAAAGLSAVQALLAAFAENSESLSPYQETAQARLSSAEHFAQARDAFAARFPDWEKTFEHMLVHHLFYECFPFSDRHETFADEFSALCALYAMLRFLLIGYTAQEPSREGFVDAAAAAFRLIEHSRFDHNAAVLLRRQGAADGVSLGNLLSI
ncbi:MAG: flagellin lysine-N-methylase [Candidatus Spyradocola sp.]|jgi:hypothetical protein